MDDDDRAAVRAAGLDPDNPAVVALLDLARPTLCGAASAYTSDPMEKNQLYYGDNLDVLPKYIKDESVDLIYLDPPFNSNRNYSVIFNKQDIAEDENKAQIEAFQDTWHWTHVTDQQFGEFVQHAPNQAAHALTAFQTLLGENDATAYLTNMAPRLLQVHRVLKSTGSIYLHCDPTMSHYLKILMDAVFDPRNFRNELIWKRTAVKGDARTKLGRNHDVILHYSKGNSPVFNRLYSEHLEDYRARFKLNDNDGRGLYRDGPLDSPNPRPNLTYSYKGYSPPKNGWRVSLDEMKRLDSEDRLIFPKSKDARIARKLYLNEREGVPLGDVWTDISPLNSQAAERFGYPTQKPLALMDRIIQASSNVGDIILDPFCGCGTTVDAAQRLDRKWIGIDISYIAVDLITKRLRHIYGDDITKTFDVDGIPKELGGARALFAKSPFDFERWAVSLIGAEPNQKQVGDKGIDGVARFPLGGKNQFGKILVSVKCGKTLNPGTVRDLGGTVDAQKAQMGILITLEPATKSAQDAIDHEGTYKHPANNQAFPKLQHITIAELFDGKRPEMPLTILPYIAAEKLQKATTQDALY